MKTSVDIPSIEAHFKCALHIPHSKTVKCDPATVGLRHVHVKVTILLDKTNGNLEVEDVEITKAGFHVKGGLNGMPYVKSGQFPAQAREALAEYVEQLVNVAGVSIPKEALAVCN